jgi:EAL domain-containing protein (putative c-di-GMP-specific phosphodiesterase class I)
MAKLNFYETSGIYVYTREFETRENEKEAMNRIMKDALENGGFCVYFQSKVDITTGKISGAEALVRLKDKDGKLVPPGKFVPLAEETGMIVEIDQFVYEETFRLIHKWLQEGKKVPVISVNLSRLHLMDDQLPEHMEALCDVYDLRPEQIELEITESVFFQDADRLIDMIKRLKAVGFVISMDDFGAGYSTLNFMKSLPVDIIKIDGGFFMKNKMDDKNKAVISAIMQLSNNLHFKTVSEGVETDEQVEFIKEQGGKYVQGYYFYKPMPPEEFEGLLEEKRQGGACL